MEIQKIVIVDDDPPNNYLCELMIRLHHPGMDVQSFTNPVEGLAYLKSLTLDHSFLVLLDLNMPEMNGWQFLDEFQQKNPAASLYILTSSINPLDEEKAAGYSCVRGYLSKPITTENIQEILNKNE